MKFPLRIVFHLGAERAYPANELHAIAFERLTGRKTVNEYDRQSLIALGFTISKSDKASRGDQ